MSFQKSAFQNNAFQVGGGTSGVVITVPNPANITLEAITPVIESIRNVSISVPNPANISLEGIAPVIYISVLGAVLVVASEPPNINLDVVSPSLLTENFIEVSDPPDLILDLIPPSIGIIIEDLNNYNWLNGEYNGWVIEEGEFPIESNAFGHNDIQCNEAGYISHTVTERSNIGRWTLRGKVYDYSPGDIVSLRVLDGTDYYEIQKSYSTGIIGLFKYVNGNLIYLAASENPVTLNNDPYIMSLIKEGNGKLKVEYNNIELFSLVDNDISVVNSIEIHSTKYGGYPAFDYVQYGLDVTITFPVGYTKEMAVYGNGHEDLVNYPVYDILIPYYPGKMRSDFGDIRFYDIEGNLITNYFRQPNTLEGITARFTVVLPFIPMNGSVLLTVEYGYPERVHTGSPEMYKIYDYNGEHPELYYPSSNCIVTSENNHIVIKNEG
jgi:hypothetical protein